MTSQILQSKIESLYRQYNGVIKPLIADIEARYENFPPELFNEIRALHDHISRCYMPSITDDQIESEINKANGHILRIVLDCYKFLNVFISDDLKKFEKKTQNVDLSAIRDGEFFPQYKKLLAVAVKTVREAKKAEGLNKDEALTKFQDAYNTYSDLELLINDNYAYICRAKCRYSVKRIAKIIGWLIAAILSGMISLLISCNQLMAFVSSIFVN